VIDAETITTGAGNIKRLRVSTVGGGSSVTIVGPLGQTTMAGSVPVAIASNQSSVPVTVGNFPATQPVSGTVDVSDRVARLVGHVNIDNFPATQPVSIAAAVDVSDRVARLVGHVQVDNFPATQPVSIAAAVDVSDRAARLLGIVYGSQNQQLKQTATNFNAQVEIAVGATLVDPRSIRTLTAADVVTANIGTLPTLTKGTQGATGFSVQELKDAGRTYICITIDRAAGIATEALATITINKAETVTTGTSYTVTTGKTLRLQTFKASVRASTTTIVSGRIRLRTAASAIAATSPIIALLEAASNGAIAEDINVDDIDFPDGVEIAATHQIGISHIESTATGTITVTLIGYEY